MAVMKGYTLPTGVTDVKQMQTQLGVKADGIWGPTTQAAYDKSQTTSQTKASTSTHKSGYSGPTVQKDGRTYTDYGALVRDDGFFYSPGARISPNGMYQDTGNGWEFAKQALAFGPNNQIYGYTPSSQTGKAPGSNVLGAGETWSRGTPATAPATTAPTETPVDITPDVSPSAEAIAAELRKQQIKAQIAEYLRSQKTLAGY